MPTQHLLTKSSSIRKTNRKNGRCPYFKNKWSLSLFLFLVIIIDQISKLIIRKSMFQGQSIQITSFFSLTYIENTGIAFGLFRGVNILFIFFTLIIIGILFVVYKQIISQDGLLAESGMILICGGAIGNLLDRIIYGKVTDFLDFGIKQYHWPVFNLADSVITIGGIILAVSFLLKSKKEDKNVS